MPDRRKSEYAETSDPAIIYQCESSPIVISRRAGCREPSWLENIELRVKKAIKCENIDQKYSHV
jgi:hypothetical protein